jgi:hypothetical protein
MALIKVYANCKAYKSEIFVIKMLVNVQSALLYNENEYRKLLLRFKISAFPYQEEFSREEFVLRTSLTFPSHSVREAKKSNFPYYN